MLHLHLRSKVVVLLTVYTSVGAAVVQSTKALPFGVRAPDRWTFITVSLVLTAAAVLASHVPARLASRLTPMVALRYSVISS